MRKWDTDSQRNLARREAAIRKREETRRFVKLTTEQKERARERNRARELEGIRTLKGIHQVSRNHPTRDAYLARLNEIPPDTRTPAQILMGDPIPNDPRRMR